MIKIIAVLVLAAVAVFGAPQLSDIELKEQSFNRINEAEYDYKWFRTLKAKVLSQQKIILDLPWAMVTSSSSWGKKWKAREQLLLDFTSTQVSESYLYTLVR